eukprot:3293942-Amphidinium_carterae.1
MRWLARLRSAHHMRWSVTVKVSLRRCRLCKQTGASPKDDIVTWSSVSRMPCSQVNVSVGSKRTSLNRQADVDIGRITADDLHGNGQADILANAGTAAHGPLEPDGSWTRWADFANKVYHVWRLVGPQLRERPDDEPRV